MRQESTIHAYFVWKVLYVQTCGTASCSARTGLTLRNTETYVLQKLAKQFAIGFQPSPLLKQPLRNQQEPLLPT